MLHSNGVLLLHLLRVLRCLGLRMGGLGGLLVCLGLMCRLRLRLSHGLCMRVAGCLLLLVHLVVVRCLLLLLQRPEVRWEVRHVGEPRPADAPLHCGDVLWGHIGRHVGWEAHAHSILLLLL